MADNVFIDSNIWLYAFMEDGEKKEAASAIISKKNCIRIITVSYHVKE